MIFAKLSGNEKRPGRGVFASLLAERRESHHAVGALRLLDSLNSKFLITLIVTHRCLRSFFTFVVGPQKDLDYRPSNPGHLDRLSLQRCRTQPKSQCREARSRTATPASTFLAHAIQQTFRASVPLDVLLPRGGGGTTALGPLPPTSLVAHRA